MTTSSTRSCPRTRSHPPRSGSSSPPPEHRCGDRPMLDERSTCLRGHQQGRRRREPETITVMTEEDQSAKPKTSTRDRDDIAHRLAEWLRGVTGADEMPVLGGLDVPDKGGL